MSVITRVAYPALKNGGLLLEVRNMSKFISSNFELFLSIVTFGVGFIGLVVKIFTREDRERKKKIGWKWLAKAYYPEMTTELSLIIASTD